MAVDFANHHQHPAKSCGRQFVPDQSESLSPAHASEPFESLSFDPQQWPQDARPVAVVGFHQDNDSVRDRYYFVQGAYSVLQGNRLARPKDNNLDRDLPSSFPESHLDVPIGPFQDPIHRTVQTTVSLIVPSSRPLGLETIQALDARTNADPQTFQITYHVTSRVVALPLQKLISSTAGDTDWSSDVLGRYLGYPDDQRYPQLAEQILAQFRESENNDPAVTKSPVWQAMAIRRWLEMNTIYVRNADHNEQSDPTASFLLEIDGVIASMLLMPLPTCCGRSESRPESQ